MNARKHAISLICLVLTGVLCAPSAPLLAQGNFLNPNSPDTQAASGTQTAAPAQQPPLHADTPATADDDLSKLEREIKAQLDAVPMEDASEEIKKEAAGLLEQARASLEKARSFRGEFQYDAEKTRLESEELRQKQQVVPPSPEEQLKPFAFTPDTELEQLKTKLSDLLVFLQKKSKEITDLKAELTKLDSRDKRKTENEAELEKAKARVAEIQKLLDPTAPADTSPPVLANAKKLQLRAELLSKEEEIAKLIRELPFYNNRRDFVTLKKTFLNTQINELTNLEKILGDHKIALMAQIQEAEMTEAERLVAKSPAPLVTLANDIVGLWKVTNDNDPEIGALARIKELQPELNSLKELLTRLEKEEDSTRKRISVATHPETLAPILDNQRGELSKHPSIYYYENEEIKHRHELNEKLGEQLSYEKQHDELINTDDELAKYLRDYLIEQKLYSEDELAKLLKDHLIERKQYEPSQKELGNKDDQLNFLIETYLLAKARSAGKDPNSINLEEQRQAFKDQAAKLFQKKREALTTLTNNYEDLQSMLEDLSDEELRMVGFLRRYHQYLDQQSMWVPVANVLQVSDFQKLATGLEPVINPASWKLLADTLVEEIVGSPLWSAVIVILLLLYLPSQTRLKRFLFRLSDEFSENFLPPFSLTRKAFFITLLLPLWIPVLIWLVGIRLKQVVPSNENAAADPAFVPAFGYALISVAFVVCILRLTRYLVKPYGLGEVHFRWPKQQLLKVRLNLHWFTVCVVPLVFLITIVYQTRTSNDLESFEARRSLGRILTVTLMLLTSWFFYRVLAPVRSRDERSSAPQLSLWQKITTYGPCCVPLFFALLSISGYTYTAAVLMSRLIFSTGILLVLVMINELGYRWVYIARGKLALEQARQRQEAREAKEAAKEEGGASEAPRIFDPKSAGVDLSSINTQTRQLLSTSFHLAIFFSMWLVWSDAIPILHQPVFGASELAAHIETTANGDAEASGTSLEGQPAANDGQNTQTPSKAKESSPDSEVKLEPDEETGVTIGDLLLVVLVPIITIIASKNLPGLLEITVLQNLPLDTGIRYAAGSIARYIVVAIGIAITCSLLGIGMTQISIMLGGLAVGLGFGLQEMFANFISGIILLFEQPLRVGDIVTIGDVTGSVSRIRIRATTITDWDRKEFIIPNKEFITGKFNNWTLSDTINRVVILVGVAYGSDTERARNLLLKVCADHPEVLSDPTPTAVFDAFGASSLNLTLRCFLPKLDNRLQTIHELHTAIDREFKKAGIEISFPQMDLHLRSIDQIKNPIPLAQELPESQQV